jgi:hypothetical protein
MKGDDLYIPVYQSSFALALKNLKEKDKITNKRSSRTINRRSSRTINRRSKRKSNKRKSRRKSNKRRSKRKSNKRKSRRKSKRHNKKSSKRKFGNFYPAILENGSSFYYEIREGPLDKYIINIFNDIKDYDNFGSLGAVMNLVLSPTRIKVKYGDEQYNLNFCDFVGFMKQKPQNDMEILVKIMQMHVDKRYLEGFLNCENNMNDPSYGIDPEGEASKPVYGYDVKKCNPEFWKELELSKSNLLNMRKINKAYRKLVLKYHPDKCKTSMCKHKFYCAKEAYDEGKRRFEEI